MKPLKRSTASRVGGLSEQQKKLLKQLQAQQNEQKQDKGRIVPKPEDFPASSSVRSSPSSITTRNTDRNTDMDAVASDREKSVATSIQGASSGEARFVPEIASEVPPKKYAPPPIYTSGNRSLTPVSIQEGDESANEDQDGTVDQKKSEESQEAKEGDENENEDKGEREETVEKEGQPQAEAEEEEKGEGASESNLLEKHKDELSNVGSGPTFGSRPMAKRQTLSTTNPTRRKEPMSRMTSNTSRKTESTKVTRVEPYKPWPVAKLISFAAKIRQQSARWLALSNSLWNLVIMDAQRVVNDREVDSLLEALSWRALGKITGPEMSVILHEWMIDSGGSGDTGLLSPSGAPLIGPSSSGAAAGASLADASKKRQQTFSLFHMRVVLVNKGYKETDIDLLIGVVVNETNQDLLGKPIAFHSGLVSPGKASRKSKKKKSKKNKNRDNDATRLEVVSQRWLSLAEELFFVLDNCGYGFLRFDELFFLASCLCLGLHGWTTMEEMHDDLSMSVIVAYAVQLLKELGCVVPTTAFRQNGLAMTLSTSMDGAPNAATTDAVKGEYDDEEEDEDTRRRREAKIHGVTNLPKAITSSAAIADECLPSASVVKHSGAHLSSSGSPLKRGVSGDLTGAGGDGYGSSSSEESYNIHGHDWNHSTRAARADHEVKFRSPQHRRENHLKVKKGTAGSSSASSTALARRGSILGGGVGGASRFKGGGVGSDQGSLPFTSTPNAGRGSMVGGGRHPHHLP